MKNNKMETESAGSNLIEAATGQPSSELQPQTHQANRTHLSNVIKENNRSLDLIKQQLDHLTHQLLELQQQMMGAGQTIEPDHFEADEFSSPVLGTAVQQWPTPLEDTPAEDSNPSAGEHSTREQSSKRELKSLFDRIQQKTELPLTRPTAAPPTQALSDWLTPNSSTDETQEKSAPSATFQKIVPELIEPPVETDVNTSWYHEAPDYDVDRYVHRVVESLHNLSANQNQSKMRQRHQASSMNSGREKLDQRQIEIQNQNLREFTPVSVPPESSSRLLAMRELANAATCLTAKLSVKRKKFIFWIRSISGLTALTGCFICVALSSQLGDFASIMGSLLTLTGLTAGILLRRKTPPLHTASIPHTARSRAILKSAKS